MAPPPRLLAAPLVLLLAAGGCMLQAGGLAEEDVPGEIGPGDGDGGWIPDGDVAPDDGTRTDDGTVIPDDADDASEPDDAVEDVPLPDGCTPELCNALDDDCDGFTDEDFDCGPGTSAPCGPCRRGRQTCTETCTWSACEIPEEYCMPGTTGTCTPATCSVGHRTCEPTCTWGVCVPDHSDCAPGSTRSCEIDPCGGGTDTCREDCTWGGCVVRCSASGRSCCPGVGCVDLDWNDDHCGDCSTNCGFLSICWDGHCT